MQARLFKRSENIMHIIHHIYTSERINKDGNVDLIYVVRLSINAMESEYVNLRKKATWIKYDGMELLE